MAIKLRKCLSGALAVLLIAAIATGGVLTAVADDKTGEGLAEYAMTAYNEGWEYVWGGASYGAVDCSGLIYSYVGSGCRTANDMMATATEWGYVSDGVPDIPGLGLWQSGHVGVYVGSGMAVDARSEEYDMCYSSVASKSWVKWFKIAGVSYDDAEEDDSDTEVYFDTSDSDTDLTDETADSASQLLQKGSTGDEVNELQRRLSEIGYFNADTTYYFGSYTESCLMQFQIDMGLDATGILDDDTKAALDSCVISTAQTSDTAEQVTFYLGEESTDNPDNTGDTDTSSDEEETVYSIGSRGNNVTLIQERLTELGYYTGDIDGYYGNDTAYAVSLFQIYSDVTPSKNVDTQTWELLFSSAAPSKEDTQGDDSQPLSVDYSIGDEGDDVTLIQERLTELGYYIGETDGYYGTDTAYAVASFQKTTELDITGDTDTATWILLFSDNAAYADEASSDTDTDSDTDKNNNTDTDSSAAAAAESDTDTGYSIYLMQGNSGKAVDTLQERLIELRYLTGDTTGIYDDETADAVRLFQENEGCPASAYITTEQYKLLMSDSAKNSPSYSTLQLGCSGDDVYRLQEELVSMRYLSNEDITEQGVYDEATQTAVENAQEDLQQEVTGTATQTFVTMLSARSAQRESQATTAVVTAAQTTASALEEVSLSKDDKAKTISDYITPANMAIAGGILALVILFFVTLHYWNVSMEKRRRRERHNDTVSVYKRRYM